MARTSSKFKRFAAPGMPPMPGAAPMAAPTMPMAASAPPRPEINGPLDSVGKILYDADIDHKISSDTGTDPSDLAMKIWTQYGGNEKGGVDEGRVGARGENSDQTPPPEADQERKATENKRWLRLPAEKTISDITSLDELTKVITGAIANESKNTAKKQQGGAPGMGGPPGGMPGMAAVRWWTRLAHTLDREDCPAQADYLDDLALQRLRKVR